MIRRYGLFLLTLPVAAAFSAAPALAQYYSSPPPGYYRSAPPPGAYYDDRQPPPAFWNDDDDDDQPVRRPRRSPQMSQVPPQGQPALPSRILPYPDEAEQRRPPPPGFAPPAGRPPVYGHQLDQQAPAADRCRSRCDPPAGRDRRRAGRDRRTPAPPVGDRRAAAGGSARARPAQGTAAQSEAAIGRLSAPRSRPAPSLSIPPNTYLYLVLGGGKAMRYGIGVGREGFTWTGTERISKMKEWPDWFPPAEMIERQPYLPRMMAGGPGNPLGARALYLGHTLYRIHGTNQPSTIGTLRFVGLHPAAQRGHRGSVQPRAGRHARRRAARQGAGDGGQYRRAAERGTGKPDGAAAAQRHRELPAAPLPPAHAKRRIGVPR